MLYLISYDIVCDKRRHRVAKCLEGMGQRVQFSVFECELSPAQFRGLRVELEGLVDLNADSIRFYPICATCADMLERLGVEEPIRHDEILVVF